MLKTLYADSQVIIRQRNIFNLFLDYLKNINFSKITHSPIFGVGNLNLEIFEEHPLAAESRSSDFLLIVFSTIFSGSVTL